MAVELLTETRWFISPALIPILLTLGILYAIHWLQVNSRSYKLGKALPGPDPLPLIGNAHLVLSIKEKSDVIHKAIELTEQYKDVFRGFLGHKLVVFLTHPDDIEIILNSNVHLDKSEEYKYFKPWLGDGLLISSGDKWRSHRKLIAPTFHQNVLKTFVELFYKNSMNVVNRMKKEMITGREFDVHEYMSEVTVDILLETAMGHQGTSENKGGFDYALAVMKLQALYQLLGLQKKEDKLLATIHGLTRKVIKAKKEIFDRNVQAGILPSPTLSEIINTKDASNPVPEKPVDHKKVKGLRDDLDEIDENDVGEKRRLAFLDLMIETAHYGAKISDEEIKEEVDTIMFEGHDTTAAGSSFVLCQLGLHQDIQKRVYNEIKEILGDSDRPCTFNDTLEMKYLERVILESLRMFPPVPAIARKVNQDVKLATTDKIIPAGTTVVVAQFKLHRRPDIYPNPDVFDPDNFLPEKTQNRHYYGFIPFSSGPRSCVGRKYAMLKLKVLISTILRNYKVMSDVPESDYKLIVDIILKRDDGFRVKLEPRVKASA